MGGFVRTAQRWLIMATATAGSAAAAGIVARQGYKLDVSLAAQMVQAVAGIVGAPLAAWAAGGMTPSVPSVARPKPIVDLPAGAVNFTGRTALLDRVRESLKAGGPVAVLALHGLGGVGKTSLALEYARRDAARYDIVWWVDAQDPALIGGQVAELGQTAGWVPGDMNVPAAAREVRRRLRQLRRWLLVFDNVETPADIVPWLPGGPGHVLITSRDHGWRGTAAHVVEVDVFARVGIDGPAMATRSEHHCSGGRRDREPRR